MDLDSVLAEQLNYYRRRAPIHEGEAADYMAPVLDEIVALMRASALTGQVLELACGTGHMTVPLSQMAAHVDAYDGAPEMLEQLEARRLPNVTTRCVDLFKWTPDRRWDAIFFNNWLAHVPDGRLEPFWSAVADALQPGGRVVFVDVTSTETWNEAAAYERDGIPVVPRRVDDQTFEIVKHWWDPDDLLAVLRLWDWDGTATPIGAAAGRGHVFYDLGRTA